MNSQTEVLETLLQLVPTGTTEGERHIIRRVFVHSNDYPDLIAPLPLSPRLVIGKKGSGKSAVIEFGEAVLRDLGIPFVTLRPSQIRLPAVSGRESVGDLTGGAERAVVQALALRVGSDLRGLLTGEEATLYAGAVEAGVVDQSFVGKLGTTLTRIASALSGNHLSNLLALLPQPSAERLAKALQKSLSASGKAIYIFIDDTDQVAAPNQPGQLNRIWSLLLAIRQLCQDVPTLRAVITLREEVWWRLLRDKAAQRDQADHFLPLARPLNPTDDHVQRVVERRLRVAIADAGLGEVENVYEPFFDGKAARMPFSDRLSAWPDLIVTRSRGRPRDAIQLIQKLAERAVVAKHERISGDDLEREMPEFSRQRVDLLAQEAELECPQIRDIVRSLSGLRFTEGAFKANSEEVREFLIRLPSEFSIVLFGEIMNPGREDHAFLMWRFLFELGVLNARTADVRERGKYRHIQPASDPSLVAKARWNDMQAIDWEVNPAYRDFLVTVRNDEQARRR